MRSFEHGYLLEQPISQSLLMTVRTLGEYRGRQSLYQEQSPELLETLRQVAMIQSVESSNRIEGVTVAADRLQAIVAKRTTPKNRPEAEVAGYRDVLSEIHANAIDERQAEPLLLIASFVFDFECIHPFWDGNGRIGRLLTLLLLYQTGYEVGRYISLERIVEESKETYYEALLKSSQGWHEAKHDLRPWWHYFLGMLIAAYKEFEERVRTLTIARGAKREIVRQAVARLPDHFTVQELRRACPGVSPDMVRLVLRELQKENLLSCEGRGPGALWRRKGNIPKKG